MNKNSLSHSPVQQIKAKYLGFLEYQTNHYHSELLNCIKPNYFIIAFKLTEI